MQNYSIKMFLLSQVRKNLKENNSHKPRGNTYNNVLEKFKNIGCKYIN